MVGPKYISLGDFALTVEFGNVIEPAVNQRAVALSEAITLRPFEGFVEAVPAYASTTIYFDVCKVRKAFPHSATAFAAVLEITQERLKGLDSTAADEADIKLIPTRFDENSALDLDFVSEKSGLSKRTVLEIFTAATYRVYMLGFLPGFSYMGKVDARIAMPRKLSPRAAVPKGSVGIAGQQTGIYSLESPGGWQIIGRTELEMFTPDKAQPCPLQPGDIVRFVPA